jgi:hypothetical protein
MKTMSFYRLLNPITFFVCIPIGIMLYLVKSRIESMGLDFQVLFFGNLILYAITALALFFHKKGMENENPNVFFRAVYGSMILRMFFCIVLVMVYAFLAGDKLNKYALLLCFIFYFLYSFLEVRLVFNLLKKKR